MKLKRDTLLLRVVFLMALELISMIPVTVSAEVITYTRPPHTPDISIVRAYLMDFKPALYWKGWDVSKGEYHKIPYHEAVKLTVQFPFIQRDDLPTAVLPKLYIGQFEYPLETSYSARGKDRFYFRMVFHLHNWQEITEGEQIVLTAFRGGPLTTPWAFDDLDLPRFHHDMIVDKRGRVFSGFVEANVPGIEGPVNATVTINGGGISRTIQTKKSGWFRIYPSLKLESGELYQVEVVVNNVLIFSETITKETSDYPRWTLNVKPQESVFYVIKGHIYDREGNLLPNVTVTLEGEDGGQYTTTSNLSYGPGYTEDGYYQFTRLFAGNYTLRATKEGYTFKPIEIIGATEKKLIIDIVETRATQCLLYAVHNTARDGGRLKWVNPAEDLTRQNLPFRPKARQMSVAVANLDADSDDEIVMAAKTGGHTITLAEFNGQTIRTFTTPMNGLLLATGDLDGDEQPEIVAASRSANRNSVQSYAPNGETLETIKLFENNTRIAPAVGDVDGDGKDDIIAGSLLKADQVVIYHSATQERQTFSVFQATQTTRKKTEKQKSEPQKPTYGVQVATGDFDGDDKDEIVAAQASKGSRVEIYHGDGTLQNAFEAFESQKGVVITVGNVIGDEKPEILVGEAKGNLIRGFSVGGEQLFEFEAVEKGTVSSLAVFGCLEE